MDYTLLLVVYQNDEALKFQDLGRDKQESICDKIGSIFDDDNQDKIKIMNIYENSSDKTSPIIQYIMIKNVCEKDLLQLCKLYNSYFMSKCIRKPKLNIDDIINVQIPIHKLSGYKDDTIKFWFEKYDDSMFNEGFHIEFETI
jgi:hypothetical protein